jgi:drug/metabolite transporter (DMT)-like permease
MSDSPAAPPPPAFQQPSPAPGWGPVGKVRNPWAVIGLSIITLGIYFLYWTYQVFREMKDHSGDGIGGPIGLVIGILIGIVNAFLIPSEVGNIFAKAGQHKPVSGPTGFWTFIPLIGFFIWTIKVQNALNDRWETAGVA